MNHPPPGRSWQPRPAWLALGMALLILGVAMAAELYRERRNLATQEMDRLQFQAQVVDENLIRQLNGANSALEGVRDDVLRLPSHRPDAGLSGRLTLLTNAMPGVRTMAVLDADGVIVASNREELLGKNFSRRDYFTIPRRHPDASTLYVSEPFQSTLGVVILCLGRTLVDPAGRFEGVVLATLDPDYFNVVLRSVSYAADMRVALIHGDGKVFTNAPLNAATLGMDIAKPGSFFSLHRDSHRTSSGYLGRAFATGEDRMVVMRSIVRDELHMDKPLVIAASRDHAAIFQPWRRQAASFGLFYATCLVLGTAVVAVRQRRMQAFDRLAAAAASERQQSARQLRLVTDHVPALISSLDREQRFRFANSTYRDWFGIEPEALIGKSLAEFYGAAAYAEFRHHIEAALEGREITYERETATPYGTRYVEVTAVPQRDEAGQVQGLYVLIHDLSERRRSELALAESEARYRRLYQSTPAILHSIDAQGRLLDVSDNWLQLMGYERPEVIGRLSSDFLTPESAQRAREVVLPEFFRSGRCDRVEYQLIHRDGALIDVRLSAVLERDAEGEPLRSLAVIENVTDAKRMAVELSRTHAQLDAIVDNVPALIGHWDREGRTRFVNREFQAATGLPLEQILERSLREIYEAVDPRAYAALDARVDRVLRGQREEFELAMLTTSGLRQLRMTLVPDRSQADQVAGFYGMAFDITGQKALELRLTDSELRYRSLFENLNSGFALHEIIIDADGRPVDYRFLAMNAAFAEMNGLDPLRSIGRCASELLPGVADAEERIGRFAQVVQSGTPRRFEQRAAERERWFEVVAYRPAAGQFAVVAQDITQRKQAEDHLRSALREKETLLKEVYHRVKNNLQVVLSLQRRSLPEGAARSALEESIQRVRAMALVHEKLYQSGNLALVSVAEYTADLLKQIAEASGAQQRGIRLVPEIADVRTGLDSAIPFGLLVAELVGNALKHGFAGRSEGEVVVRLAPCAEGASLSVCDDGNGLADGFDLPASTSMGLHLATGLARQLGGELEAGNDRGARFSAVLKGL